MLQIGLLFLLLLSEHVASAPPPIIYHIPFSLRPGEHGGCCGDITALNEHNGIAHLFKESGGVHDNTSKGLGFAHYTSADFVHWKYLSTVVTRGG
eukprot:gene15244-4223_t